MEHHGTQVGQQEAKHIDFTHLILPLIHEYIYIYMS